MMNSVPTYLAMFLMTSLTIIIHVQSTAEFARPSAKGFRSHWLAESTKNRNDLIKKWFDKKQPDRSSALSSFDTLQMDHQFKGCIDPSEPFQCPQSERCIALQFICDGHPGDCPGDLDENEETCIAGIEIFFFFIFKFHIFNI